MTINFPARSEPDRKSGSPDPRRQKSGLQTQWMTRSHFWSDSDRTEKCGCKIRSRSGTDLGLWNAGFRTMFYVSPSFVYISILFQMRKRIDEAMQTVDMGNAAAPYIGRTGISYRQRKWRMSRWIKSKQNLKVNKTFAAKRIALDYVVL